MALAAEADALLREIREIRAARQRQLEHDLAEIDRTYEQDVLCRQRAAVRRTVLMVAVTSTLAAAVACLVTFAS